MPLPRLFPLLIGLSCSTAALAAANWAYAPQAWVYWTGIALFFPLLTMGIARKMRTSTCGVSNAEERNFLKRSILLSGLIISTALMISLAKQFGFEVTQAMSRIFGFATGVALLVLGNALPKILPKLPEDMPQETASRIQDLRRSVGWVIALSGIGYSAGWLILAKTDASRIGLMICGAAFVFSLIQSARARAASRRHHTHHKETYGGLK